MVLEVKKTAFKRIVQEWRERPIPEIIPRDIKIKESADTITAVIGPRRVGKTFLMLARIKELLKENDKDDILFVDFEDNRLVGIKPQELDELFVAHRELTGKTPKYLFFDEVHQAPQWSKFVRRLHNLNKYKMIVSGSSSKLLGKEIATELRGRYRSILVLPFSFKEFLEFKGFSYDKGVEFSEKKGDLLRLFSEYLQEGGYPLIMKEQDKFEKRAIVKSYFDTIFYKDIIERHKIKNFDVIEILMNHLLENNACIFSVSSIEKMLKQKEIHTSKKTISLYLKFIEEAFFVLGIEKFSYSSKKRVLNPRKTYLVDNCFQTFLSSNPMETKGRLLEALVLQELKRRGLEVFYFKNGKECDFIVKESKNLLQAIQVTFELNEEDKQREFSGLAKAMDDLKIKQGIILTYDQEEQMEFQGKKISVVPAWKWALA